MNEKQVVEKIKEYCETNPYIETCGFVGFDEEKNKFIVEPKENISDDPKKHFMLNTLEYLLFKEKYRIVGIYHSHIKGNEKPSEFDIKMSENCCDPFIIYGLNTKKIHIYEPKNMDLDVDILNRIKEAND